MKPTEKQIHIYCTAEIHKKLLELADANGRTMSRQVQTMINQAYAEFVRQSKNDMR